MTDLTAVLLVALTCGRLVWLRAVRQEREGLILTAGLATAATVGWDAATGQLWPGIGAAVAYWVLIVLALVEASQPKKEAKTAK
jgi:hypothetical protein